MTFRYHTLVRTTAYKLPPFNSQVLPNVPQSRLKNQPRLETVGLGVKFHQEELFIFHSTLTELHVNIQTSNSLRGKTVISGNPG